MNRVVLPVFVVSLALGSIGIGHAQSPANDNFANRIAVSGAFPITASGSCVNATVEVGEPDHANPVFGNMASNSVWWTWTSTVDGTATFAAADADFDCVVSIYTGASLATLVRAGDADQFEAGAEVAAAIVESGVTYAIAVDGFSGTRGVVQATGDFDLVIDFVPQPANDDFADGEEMDFVLPAIDSGTTAGATAELGEPNHAPPNGASNSVWYRWTAPTSGTVVASAGGAGLDAVVGVYTGSTILGLTSLGAVDVIGPGGRESVTFTAAIGTTYSIAVDTYSVDNLPVVGGEFTVVVSVSPSNDQFATRQSLGGSLPVLGIDGSTIGASSEVGEPEHAQQPAPAVGNLASNSVWYSWTAPRSALVGVNVASELSDSVIGVYTGTSLATLDEEAFADRWAGTVDERAVFQAVSGTQYVIAVDAFSQDTTSRRSGVEGLFELNIYEVPPNDNSADTEDLFDLALPLSRTGTTLHASSEFAAGEPNHAFDLRGNLSSNTVWYQWMATSAGRVQVDLSQIAFDGVLVVYSVDVNNAITEVGASDAVGAGTSESLTFNALAGQTYAIAIDVFSADGSDAGGGSFMLDLSVGAPPGAFEIWIAGFPSITGAEALRDADPAGDGVANLVKLVLGLNPTLRLAEDPNRGNFPKLIMVGDNPALEYSVVPGNLGAGADAIIHGGESSTDLADWSDAPATNSGGNTWVIEIDATGVDGRYGRLKITDPAG